jgi:DNA-binding CsgD family transcriptional regulator
METAGLGSILTTSEQLLQLLKEADELGSGSEEGFKLDKRAVVALDSEGRLLYVSPAFAELFGVDGADAIGQRHPFPWCNENRTEPCRRRCRFLASDRARELGIDTIPWGLERISRECLRAPRNGRMTFDDCEPELRQAVCLAVSERAVLEEIPEAGSSERGSQMNEIDTTLRRISVELERLGVSPGAQPTSIRPRLCPELDSLSPREGEVVRLFVEGSRVQNIARALCISRHTVRNHLQSVYRKFGVGSQAELIEKLKGPARPSPVRERFLHAVGAR